MRNQQRTQTGSIIALAFVGMIPLCMAIGALAIDFMHYNAVQAELQRAADAGALAGAEQLWQYGTAPTAPIAAAQAIAGANEVDGQLLSAPATGATITPTIDQAPNYTASPPVYGQVRCTISYPYKNIWSYLFSARGASCTVSALAGVQGQPYPKPEVMAGGLYPLAIADDVADPITGKVLTDPSITIGSTLNLQWHANVAWTGFTGHSASQVAGYIASYGQPGGSSNSPTVDVGYSTNVTNGIQSSNVSAMAADVGDVVTLPVVHSGGSLGPGNFPVTGFIGFLIQSSSGSGAGQIITGKLVPAMTYANNNGTTATSYPPGSTLANAQPIDVRLIR